MIIKKSPKLGLTIIFPRTNFKDFRKKKYSKEFMETIVHGNWYHVFMENVRQL